MGTGADVATGGVTLLQFRLAGVDVMTSGSCAGSPGQQYHTVTLKGPGGEIVMFVFGAGVPDVAATRQGPEFWSIECPLQEHGPLLAQLNTALHHAVDVMVRETPNRGVTWQFAGKFV